MKCLDLQDYFSVYYEGEMGAEDRVSFEEHLGSCRECAREYESFRQALTAIATIGDYKAPPEIIGSLNRKIDELEGKAGILSRFFGVILKVVPQALALLFFFVLGASSFHLYMAYLKRHDVTAQGTEVASLVREPAVQTSNAVDLASGAKEKIDPSVELREERPLVEVLPASANPSELQEKIREIATLSKGEVFELNGGLRPKEMVVKIPATSYREFVLKLRNAMAEAQKRRMKDQGIAFKALTDLKPGQTVEAKSSTVENKAHFQGTPGAQETPIPEVTLIRVLYR